MAKKRSTTKLGKREIIGGIAALAVFAFLVAGSGVVGKGAWGAKTREHCYALSEAGMTYTAPPGWKVYDPLTEEESQKRFPHHWKVTGISLLSGEQPMATAMFVSPGGLAVRVSVQKPEDKGRGESSNSIERIAETWKERNWNPSDPISRERTKDELTLGDGSVLPSYKGRLLPGALSRGNDDWTFYMANARVKGRDVLIASGGNSDMSVLLEDIPELARALRLAPQ